MKLQYKPLYIASVIAVFFSIVYISCNKDKGTPETSTVVYKCTAASCENGGVCDAITGKCACTKGYEDFHCETMSRDKFIGTWLVTETRTSLSTILQYQVSIQPGTNDDEVVIQNFYNYYNLSAVGKIVGDSMFIPSQIYHGKIIVGRGFIHSTTTSVTVLTNSGITLRYQATDTTTLAVDDFGYNTTNPPSEWNR